MTTVAKIFTLKCGYTVCQREHEREMAATTAAHDSNVSAVKMVLSTLGSNPSDCRFAVMHARLYTIMAIEQDSAGDHAIKLLVSQKLS